MLTRRAALTALAGLAATRGARAQSFPSRPITIVVPYPAGGPVDVTARLIAQSVGNDLGQPIAVDNRGGGAGVIGSVAVQHAEPDGHTLILGTNQTHATNQSLLKNCPYDAVKDFAAVAGIADIPHVLVVRRGLEAENVGALVAARQEIARRAELRLDRRRLGLAPRGRIVQDQGRRGLAAHPVPRLGADDHRASGRPHRSHLCDAAERHQLISTPACCARSRSRAPSARRGCRTCRRSPKPASPASRPMPGSRCSHRRRRLPRRSKGSTARCRPALTTEAASKAIAAQGMTLALRSPAELAAWLPGEVAKWAAVIKAAGVVAE